MGLHILTVAYGFCLTFFLLVLPDIARSSLEAYDVDFLDEDILEEEGDLDLSSFEEEKTEDKALRGPLFLDLLCTHKNLAS